MRFYKTSRGCSLKVGQEDQFWKVSLNQFKKALYSLILKLCFLKLKLGQLLRSVMVKWLQALMAHFLCRKINFD